MLVNPAPDLPNSELGAYFFFELVQILGGLKLAASKITETPKCMIWSLIQNYKWLCCKLTERE